MGSTALAQSLSFHLCAEDSQVTSTLSPLQSPHKGLPPRPPSHNRPPPPQSLEGLRQMHYHRNDYDKSPIKPKCGASPLWMSLTKRSRNVPPTVIPGEPGRGGHRGPLPSLCKPHRAVAGGERDVQIPTHPHPPFLGLPLNRAALTAPSAAGPLEVQICHSKGNWCFGSPSTCWQKTLMLLNSTGIN